MLRQCDFFEQLLVQNEFIFNLNGMNEACIWHYIFLAEVCVCVCVWVGGWVGGLCVGGEVKTMLQCWHNIKRGGYLMMMLDYKGGGGQESGKKWLRNATNYVIRKLLSI